METPTRKKSPRAPSSALDEALERALRLYEKERRHAVPVELAAQAMGYKGAKNGAALTTLATLRYYGLLDRPEEGMLRVSADVEHYKFNPSDEARTALKIKWLRAPVVFSDLLSIYENSLPSDDTLRYDLIKRGFSPETAADCAVIFRRSVEWADYFAQASRATNSPPDNEEETPLDALSPEDRPPTATQTIATAPPQHSDVDRIPIRLEGGRKAWLEVPIPLYEKDKIRMKAQIDLLLTDE